MTAELPNDSVVTVYEVNQPLINRFMALANLQGNFDYFESQLLGSCYSLRPRDLWCHVTGSLLS